MAVSKHWCNLEIDTNKHKDLNFVFVTQGKEDEIYPLTTVELVEAHRKDQELKVYFKKDAIKSKEMYIFILLKTHK